jgi:hypothetical protein
VDDGNIRKMSAGKNEADIIHSQGRGPSPSSTTPAIAGSTISPKDAPTSINQGYEVVRD